MDLTPPQGDPAQPEYVGAGDAVSAEGPTATRAVVAPVITGLGAALVAALVALAVTSALVIRRGRLDG
ncbi:hypothetical protein [Microbacterium sp. Se5.02b]|uniref:hypothetical protein n=1 Tax=Microbacterium sp. Se5.02b TaxID=2864103 RepID=UPI001604EE55|nr:hypothetical protein [Microbacterium sp. Se5.02b]QNA91815.1 hypothetical protein G4G29_03990 [Microbacterium sp. Se63.02b]QYM65018.1 hypothetical protein K1X59_03980 [Microbacterium sp. Se5.02b]